MVARGATQRCFAVRYDFARDSTLSCSMPCLPSLLCSEAGHMPLFRFEVL